MPSGIPLSRPILLKVGIGHPQTVLNQLGHDLRKVGLHGTLTHESTVSRRMHIRFDLAGDESDLPDVELHLRISRAVRATFGEDMPVWFYANDDKLWLVDA